MEIPKYLISFRKMMVLRTFCIVMKSANAYRGDSIFFGQFSLETIQDCFDELGYELKINSEIKVKAPAFLSGLLSEW